MKANPPSPPVPPTAETDQSRLPEALRALVADDCGERASEARSFVAFGD